MLAVRQLSLLAAGLLAVMVAVAVAARHEHTTRTAVSTLPRPAISDVTGWYTALADVRTRALGGHPSGCGTLLRPDTLGVAHPVLPCGAKLFVRYGGKTVLTEVVDRGPPAPGHDFDLTAALARRLGVQGVQVVAWTFAEQP